MRRDLTDDPISGKSIRPRPGPSRLTNESGHQGAAFALEGVTA